MQSGVLSYGLNDTGVHVVICDPETAIPSQIEALPVSVELRTGCDNMANLTFAKRNR